MEEAGVPQGAKQREAAPQSAKAFCAFARRKMAEVSFALLCPSRTAESHPQIVVSTLLFRNLIARGAGSLRPSSGCTCFGLDSSLDQFLASAS